MEILFYLSLWLFLAIVVYTITLFPLMLVTDRFIVRLPFVLLFASCVAPGWTVGHGLFPMPPLLWLIKGAYNINDAVFFSASTLITAGVLMSYDVWRRVTFARSGLSKPRALVRLFFGPRMWFSLQLVAFIVFDTVRQPNKYEDNAFDFIKHYLFMALLLYLSTVMLAKIKHRFSHDYYKASFIYGQLYAIVYYIVKWSGFTDQNKSWHYIAIAVIMLGNSFVYFFVKNSRAPFQQN